MCGRKAKEHAKVEWSALLESKKLVKSSEPVKSHVLVEPRVRKHKGA